MDFVYFSWKKIGKADGALVDSNGFGDSSLCTPLLGKGVGGYRLNETLSNEIMMGGNTLIILGEKTL
jgi:hypothetical protein